MEIMFVYTLCSSRIRNWCLLCAYVMAILMLWLFWFENCRINHWFHRISFVIINFITIRVHINTQQPTNQPTHTLSFIPILILSYVNTQVNYKRKLINPIFLFSWLFFSFFFLFLPLSRLIRSPYSFRFASSRLLIYNKTTLTHTHESTHFVIGQLN